MYELGQREAFIKLGVNPFSRGLELLTGSRAKMLAAKGEAHLNAAVQKHLEGFPKWNADLHLQEVMHLHDKNDAIKQELAKLQGLRGEQVVEGIEEMKNKFREYNFPARWGTPREAPLAAHLKNDIQNAGGIAITRQGFNPIVAGRPDAKAYAKIMGARDFETSGLLGKEQAAVRKARQVAGGVGVGGLALGGGYVALRKKDKPTTTKLGVGLETLETAAQMRGVTPDFLKTLVQRGVRQGVSTRQVAADLAREYSHEGRVLAPNYLGTQGLEPQHSWGFPRGTSRPVRIARR